LHLIVTGDACSGKTTWCAAYAGWLTEQGLAVGGILCLEVREGQRRIGYDVVDLQTHRTVPFGRVAPDVGFSGERVGGYVISHDGLEFAVEALRHAVGNKCGMVFIDEVGPLELAGRGLAASAVTAYGDAPNTTTIVRKVLLPLFLEWASLMEYAGEFSTRDLELDPTFPLLQELAAGARAQGDPRA